MDMLSRVWIPALKYRAHEIKGEKTTTQTNLNLKKKLFCLFRGSNGLNTENHKS